MTSFYAIKTGYLCAIMSTPHPSICSGFSLKKWKFINIWWYNKWSWLLFCLITVNITLHAQQKTVLFEQFTGAWCGYCPNGALIADDLSTNDARVISVKIHHNDIMEVPGLITNDFYSFAYGQGGFPAASFNRVAKGGTGFSNLVARDVDWKTRLTEQLSGQSIAEISITGFTYNPGTRSFSLTAAAKFLQALEGEIRWNLYLVEDSVNNSSAAYNQRSYYHTTAGHPLVGKGDPLLNYTHRHVLRKAWGGAWGIEGSVAGVPDLGKSLTYTFSGSVAPEFNIQRCRLVVFVQRYHTTIAQREILEARQITFTQAVTTNLTSSSQQRALLRAYPQPARSGVTVEYRFSDYYPTTLRLISLSGVVVWSSEIPGQNSDITRIVIPTANLPAGMYYLCRSGGLTYNSIPIILSP